MSEQWTNSAGWFNLCKIRRSAVTVISGLGNMKVCSELFVFIVVRINQVYYFWGSYTGEDGFCTRAVSCLLNLNQFQDLKFDIVYDNRVSLQTIVVYMKFPKEAPAVGWGKWPILSQFYTTTSFAGMHVFEICHVRYI